MHDECLRPSGLNGQSTSRRQARAPYDILVLHPRRGHNTQERVRKANETTIRIEAKLEEFIGILHNNYGENIDDNETNPTIRQQKAIAAASGASGSLVVEEERKRVESTREKPAGRGQDDNESRRSSSGEPIDEFIHDYH